MHSALSNQLGARYTVATTACRSNGVTRFSSTPRSALNTLPFHANRCVIFAATSANSVPGAAIAVPSYSPSGIAPAGLREKSASSSSADIATRAPTSMAPPSVLPLLMAALRFPAPGHQFGASFPHPVGSVKPADVRRLRGAALLDGIRRAGGLIGVTGHELGQSPALVGCRLEQLAADPQPAIGGAV